MPTECEKGTVLSTGNVDRVQRKAQPALRVAHCFLL